MEDFLSALLIVLVVLAVVAVAGYFILRRIFLSAADRVAQHTAQALGEIANSAIGTRVSATATRVASGRITNLGAYAAANGMSEEAARLEFVRSIETLSNRMDNAVRLPIIGGVGLDAVLGLVPVAGDLTSAAVSLALIARSVRYGVPREIITKMLANVLIDFLIGEVPFIGDLADLWFKANVRNVAILKEYLGDEARNTIDVRPIGAAVDRR
jgi:hypothetical protein